MSKFCGRFDEFPYISADRFDDENRNSKLFFLSHCHADHMVGLCHSSGLPGPLYVSAVSKVLVQKQFPQVKDVRVLDIDCPEELSYDVNGVAFKILVTALPARHCPGSIMFVFQTDKHKVLYTGDFRLTKNDLEKHFSSLRHIEPDTVYLDSTFLNRNFMYFPNQVDSINVICKLITEWISASAENKVIIHTPAQYGSEFIFTEIGRKLKQKMYVPEKQFEKYIYFPDMDHCISINPAECKIYLNSLHENMKVPNNHCRRIQPTAMFWKNWKPSCPIYRQMNSNHYRVAYSSHSSYDEIKEFLQFIKPKKVQLNVFEENTKESIKKCLDQILKEITGLEKSIKPIGMKCRFDNLLQLSKETSEERNSSLRMPAKRVKL